MRSFVVVSITLLTAMSICGQTRAISKEVFWGALERARNAATYPYRETITFGPFTEHEDALDPGTEVTSQTIRIEYSASDRLRITTETEREGKKSVRYQMQIGSNCYTLGRLKWNKNDESCVNEPFTVSVAPSKEEFSVEYARLAGMPVRLFRYVSSTVYSSEPEVSTFMLDPEGRLVKREHGNTVKTYEYGIRIKPITVPIRTKNTRSRLRAEMRPLGSIAIG